MRPFLAVLIVAGVFSLLGLYTRFEQSVRNKARPSRIVQSQAAAGEYSLQIELTFDAAGDPFSLDQSSVVVQLGGRELLRREQPASAGETLVVDNVPGVVQGRNEFYVKVAPSDQQRGAANAVRVRMLRDGAQVPGAEATLWSEPGQAVAGPVVVNVDAPPAHDEHRDD